MRNNSKTINIITKLIFIVVFNTIIFLTVSEFTSTFWVAYVFIHIAYLSLIITSYTIPKVKNAHVFGYPLLYLSYAFFIITFTLGIVFLIFKDISWILVLSIHLIITGVYVFIYLVNVSANKSTIQAEKHSQENILYIKIASVEIEQLMYDVNDQCLAKALEDLYDLICSSQVKSHPSLADLEMNIMQEIKTLKQHLVTMDEATTLTMIQSIKQQLLERNNKISLFN